MLHDDGPFLARSETTLDNPLVDGTGVCSDTSAEHNARVAVAGIVMIDKGKRGIQGIRQPSTVFGETARQPAESIVLLHRG